MRARRERAVAPVRWGMARSAAPQQEVSGDMEVVLPFPSGVLLGAVDGLGHGGEAAEAARTTLAALKEDAAEALPALFKRCHKALLETRGVVMSLASYLADREGRATLSWLGVGNVEAVLVRDSPGAQPNRQSLLLRNGVVGYMMPRLAASLIQVQPADLLVMATDGIRSDFAELVTPGDPPQLIADRILAERAKGWDDALVLVARLDGRAP